MCKGSAAAAFLSEMISNTTFPCNMLQAKHLNAISIIRYPNWPKLFEHLLQVFLPCPQFLVKLLILFPGVTNNSYLTWQQQTHKPKQENMQTQGDVVSVSYRNIFVSMQQL